MNSEEHHRQRRLGNIAALQQVMGVYDYRKVGFYMPDVIGGPVPVIKLTAEEALLNASTVIESVAGLTGFDPQRFAMNKIRDLSLGDCTSMEFFEDLFGFALTGWISSEGRPWSSDVTRKGFARKLISLLLAKNRDYGNAAHQQSIFAQDLSPITGILVRASDKFNRLQTILNGDAAVKDETLADTWRDLAVTLSSECWLLEK